MKERLGDSVVRCVGYGHVGDGNMHLNITTKEYDDKVMNLIEPFLYEWTSQQKGSISAEHGTKGFLLLSELGQFEKRTFCFRAGFQEAEFHAFLQEPECDQHHEEAQDCV